MVGRSGALGTSMTRLQRTWRRTSPQCAGPWRPARQRQSVGPSAQRSWPMCGKCVQQPQCCVTRVTLISIHVVHHESVR